MQDSPWFMLSPCNLLILNPLCSFPVRKKRTDYGEVAEPMQDRLKINWSQQIDTIKRLLT